LAVTSFVQLQFQLNPTSEVGLSVAATPRRRKVQATPSSPVAAAIIPLPGKMRLGRRYHPVATRRRPYFRLAASEFGMNCRRQRAADADEFPAHIREFSNQTTSLTASEGGSNGQDDSSSQDR
jgi:hypothetical protein